MTTQEIPGIKPLVERHNLPSGGWVEIRALSTLRAKHAKMITRATRKPDRGEDGEINVMSYAVDMADVLLTVMITAWSIPYEPDWPIPNLCVMRDPETGAPIVLDELQPADYNAITAACEPAQKLLFPPKVTPDDAEKKGSPGAPASE